MTVKLISDLPAAGSVNGADLLPIMQGGVTKKATASQLPGGGGGGGGGGPTQYVEHSGSEATLGSGDLGKYHGQYGGGITFTLPPASGGGDVGFLLRYASGGTLVVQVAPGSSDFVQLPAGQDVNGLRGSTTGDAIRLIADGVHGWFAIAIVGTSWTLGTGGGA
jgi:hypothetical protein